MQSEDHDVREFIYTLDARKIAEVTQRLNNLFFQAGYIQAQKDPSGKTADLPQKIYVELRQSYGKVNLHLDLSHDYTDPYFIQNVPGVRLDQDDLEAHSSVMQHFIQYLRQLRRANTRFGGMNTAESSNSIKNPR